MLAGCGDVHIPFGDGRLVLVDVDPEFGKHQILNETESHWIGIGLHYWDVVGARIRTTQEAADEPEAAIAPHVSIVRSEIHLGDYVGTCWSGERKITLYADRLETDGASNWTWEASTAHELGHLMGLSHVGDPTAIMNADIPSMGAIDDGDVTEFRSVYH
jgi:hypothetical protein